MEIALNHPTFGPTRQEVRQIVIFLHGVGSNGQDLISLAPSLAAHMPHALFLSPHAPFPFDMAPGMGDSMRQWFSLIRFDPASCLAGIRDCAPLCEVYLDQMSKKHNVDRRNIFLFGFSQGAMLALYVGLRYGLGGICAFSGSPPGDWLPDPVPPNPSPVLMVHGKADPVVPWVLGHQSHQALRDAGVPVEAQFPDFLVHTIDEDGINAAAQFLAQRIAATPPADTPPADTPPAADDEL